MRSSDSPTVVDLLVISSRSWLSSRLPPWPCCPPQSYARYAPTNATATAVNHPSAATTPKQNSTDAPARHTPSSSGSAATQQPTARLVPSSIRSKASSRASCSWLSCVYGGIGKRAIKLLPFVTAQNRLSKSQMCHKRIISHCNVVTIFYKRRVTGFLLRQSVLSRYKWQ
ncbi:hypothetical protein BDV93DRAFT_371921 [Ceratobasidium sp. AG-I]|nr:hypothetical protein BDV93DRAFT_371921 [Ceratobasidium sp. AG-I]